MKGYSRRKEMIKNGIYIVVGVVGIVLITNQLQAVGVENDKQVVKEVEEMPVISVSEQELSLNIEEIIKSSEAPISSEHMTELMTKLPEKEYLQKVEIKLGVKPGEVQKVAITYDTKQYEQMLSKARKDQMSLIDASIIMALYSEIDRVEVSILEKDSKYFRILYRPDLEDYFGIKMDTKDNRNAFERIAKEFLDAEHVSAYWNRKHPYDSELGEEVEAFFKLNFPILQDTQETFPYIDEEMEESLVEKYGYKLFLQGLKYDNPLMNYYCAYRLVEYYDSIHKEEIMLELANCQVHSKDSRVQNACGVAVELLTNLQDGEVRLFDRYKETTLGGGEKLFKIDKSGISVFAKWEGSVPAGLNIVSISPRNSYVLCMAVTNERNYIYALPIQAQDKVQVFSLKEEGAYITDTNESVKKGDELINLMNSRIHKSKKEIENSVFEWYYASFVKVIVDGENYIYDGETNQLMTYDEFSSQFDQKKLQAYLDERFKYTVKKSSFYYPTKAEASCIYIDEEKLVIREYSYIGQKTVEFNSPEEKTLQGRRWDKGKVVVNYSGNNQEIIRALNEIMG